MNASFLETPVGQLVRQRPARARIFERAGIDYCCHGNTKLAEACQQRGLSAETVCGELAALDAEPVADGTDWGTAPLTQLADHIEQTHHVYLRTELPRLGAILDKVVNAHADAHPELRQVRQVFQALVDELSSHLLKEERILFPLVRHLETNRDFSTMHCGGVQNPIRVMEHEHDNAGGALAQLRSLTNNYTLPAGACATYQVLFDGLQALELDLHTHIHKENNILFPRAIELQTELLGQA